MKPIMHRDLHVGTFNMVLVMTPKMGILDSCEPEL